MMIINIPHVLVDDTSNLIMCSISDIEKGFYIYLSNLIISSLLPSSIMIFCTCFTVHYLVTKKRRTNQTIPNYNREIQFVKSVLTMDLWFFICYTPFCIITFLHYTRVYEIVNNEDLWKLLFDSCVILSSIETSFNFFIYYSVGVLVLLVLFVQLHQ